MLKTIKHISDITLAEMAEHCSRTNCKECDLSRICAIMRISIPATLENIDMDKLAAINIYYEDIQA